mmetsp:Transcript_35056/g.86209  ORF Transcript_35056/g.86209 Transcript_35056/m.86209 type:complete len:308 (+) Transcript_35056:659-1582(+)
MPPLHPRELLPLAAGEVDEVELRAPLRRVERVRHAHAQREDEVRAGALLVHRRRARRAVQRAHVEQLQTLVRVAHRRLHGLVCVSLLAARVLPHSEGARVGGEEVDDGLVVDLDERHTDLDGVALGHEPRGALEDVLERARDDARPLPHAVQLPAPLHVPEHCERLARARLPVGQHRDVVALQKMVARRSAHLREERLLRGVGGEHVIELVRVEARGGAQVLLLADELLYGGRAVLLAHDEALVPPVARDLDLAQGPCAHNHRDILPHILLQHAVDGRRPRHRRHRVVHRLRRRLTRRPPRERASLL